MNLDQCRIVLRPRSVAEVLDLALRVMTATQSRLYGWLGAIFLLPCLALCVAARYVAEWEWAPVWILAVALGSVVQGVFTVASGRLLFSENLTVGEVSRHFFGRFWSYMGTLMLSRLLLGLGSLGLFLLFPFFWVWNKVAFVHEASLLEQAPPGEAIKRASRFVATRSSSTLLLTLCFVLAHLVFIGVFESVGNAGILEFLLQSGQPFGTLLDGGSPFALAGFFASIPYVATARFLAYVDQRTRMDGWDIQLKFMAIGARAHAHASPGTREEAA